MNAETKAVEKQAQMPTVMSVMSPVGRSIRSNQQQNYGDYAFIDDDNRTPQLRGLRQFRTFKTLVRRTPIVGVAAAQSMMACGKATYRSVASSSEAEDVAAAEQMEYLLFGQLKTSVRDLNKQLGMHQLNGFSVVEWDGIKDENGLVCVHRTRNLPPESIPDFRIDRATTEIVGFVQRTYEGRPDVIVPRWKALYPLEAGGTNSPRGRSLLYSIAEQALQWIQISEGKHRAMLANLRRRPTLLAPINELREMFRSEVELALQGESGVPPDKAAVDAKVFSMLKEVLQQPLAVIDADNPDPDHGFVLDSSVERGDAVDNSTRPITTRKYEVIYAPPINIQDALADMTSLTQDMARELHMHQTHPVSYTHLTLPTTPYV